MTEFGQRLGRLYARRPEPMFTDSSAELTQSAIAQLHDDLPIEDLYRWVVPERRYGPPEHEPPQVITDLMTMLNPLERKGLSNVLRVLDETNIYDRKHPLITIGDVRRSTREYLAGLVGFGDLSTQFTMIIFAIEG